MNMRDFRDDLSAYMDNELEPNRRAEMEAALAESAELRDTLARLRRVDALFHAAAVPDCPDELAGAVLDTIDTLPRAARNTVRLHRSRHLVRRRATAQLAAAALLLLGGFGMVAYLRMAPPQAGRRPAEAFMAMQDKVMSDENFRASQTEPSKSERGGGDARAVYPVTLMEAPAMAAPGEADSMAEDIQAEDAPAGVDYGTAGAGQKNAQSLDRMPVATGAASAVTANTSPAEPRDGAQTPAAPAPMRAKAVGRRNDLGFAAPKPAQAPATPSPTSPVPVPAAAAGDGLRDLPSPVSPAGRPAGAGQGAYPPPPPQQIVVAGRVFLPHPKGWVEVGYGNGQTTAVERDSDTWKQLAATDAVLDKVAELRGEVIFQSKGAWYRLFKATPAP